MTERQHVASSGAVSVVMVSYRTGPSLARAVDSVLDQPECGELWLIDNGNPLTVRRDIALRALRDRRLRHVLGHGNVGFARGCNLGAALASGQHLLFLNPDSELPAGSLARLLAESAELPRPWLCGCRLTGVDGSEQRGSRREMLTPWSAFVEVFRADRWLGRFSRSRRLHQHDTDLPASTSRVPVVSGACMFLRADDYRSIDGFDEGYFLHVEDIDLCHRITQTGGGIWFVPSVSVLHHRSTSRASTWRIEWHKARGFVRYFETHFRASHSRALLWLVYAGVAGRSLLRCAFDAGRSLLPRPPVVDEQPLPAAMPASIAAGRILVTGANGFIGGHLCAGLWQDGVDAVGMTRRPSWGLGDRVRYASLDDSEALLRALQGIDTVVHCAGYAHAWNDPDPERLHWQINALGTERLVQAAVRAGVRRLVFASSVRAAEAEGPGPHAAYAQAKRYAEQCVLEAGRQHGLHVVNLRLTMVYGPGGRGNLERLIRAVRAGWCPPLPDTGNRRSMVHVDDVVQAIRLAIDTPALAGGTYTVSDGVAYSGADVYDAIRHALALRPVSWRVPAALLRGAGRLGDAAGRWFGHRFPVDSETIERLLGTAWHGDHLLTEVSAYRPQHTLHSALPDILAWLDARPVGRTP